MSVSAHELRVDRIEGGFADIQEPRALGAHQPLVSACRVEITSQVLQIKVYSTKSLRSINQRQDTPLTSNIAQFLSGDQDASDI